MLLFKELAYHIQRNTYNFLIIELNCIAAMMLPLRRTLVRQQILQQLQPASLQANSKLTKTICKTFVSCHVALPHMNDTDAIKNIYSSRVEQFSKALQIVQQKRNRIAWLRFAVVAATAAAIYFLWHTEIWIITVTIIAGIGCFLYVISLDANSKDALLNTQRLIAINKEEIEILNYNYSSREDGTQYKPAHHYYADDLDLFGSSSLYQYINRCNGEQSKQLLATNFLNALPKEEILLQQQAVKELANKIDWCQQLRSYGIASPVSISTEKRVNHWLQQKQIFTEAFWQWLINIFPFISLGSVALYLFEII